MGKKSTSGITENEGSGKTKAIWNDGLVAIFYEICVKEVAKGNRPGTHFDKIGWVNVVNVFKEITGRDYDKKQLKNKWDSLKTDWKLWSSLMHKETGDQDRGEKRTNDESDIRRGLLGGSKLKKGKLGGAAKLSKQIDRLVEVVESRSTATSMRRSSQETSITEVMEAVATLPGAEKGQGIGNRNAQERFQRSGETVSRYFDVMLDILYEMHLSLPNTLKLLLVLTTLLEINLPNTQLILPTANPKAIPLTADPKALPPTAHQCQTGP
ncbi:hypothetical protein Dsin_017537 [Dipteronia sinensis]|uniref:Myb/SANT-like domain-containing protein n=1 Tax=Dipteronia sinensis TaxID=43782 RepID=A0AAE0AF57_9ROSI|nr:hypothetical protein Dsin_017537 [Dipteronia sinensis]